MVSGTIPLAEQIAAAKPLIREARTPAPARYVAYYRVSTAKQGTTGIGLDAQREAVSRYIEGGELAAEFQEIESGRKKNRPALTAALAECRRTRAILVIAKLDRLARNVHFISGLIESRVQFICCDNPHVHSRDHQGRFMLNQLANMAEWEAGAISQRTKEALAVVRKRGTRLGNPRWHESIEGAREARNKVKAAPQIVALMKERRAQGNTYRQIANDLNALQIAAPRGGIWHGTTVRKTLARIAASL